jgi:nitroreductase
MAVQNLLLVAHGAGLGACWTDGAIFYKEAEFNNLFGVSGKKLVSIVPIGYPNEEPRVPARQQGRVTWVRFGG